MSGQVCRVSGQGCRVRGEGGRLIWEHEGGAGWGAGFDVAVEYAKTAWKWAVLAGAVAVAARACVTLAGAGVAGARAGLSAGRVWADSSVAGLGLGDQRACGPAVSQRSTLAWESLAMGESRVPRSDAEFDTWAGNYGGAVYNFYDFNGLDTTPVLALLDAISQWQSAYAEHVAAQARAQSATQAKLTARAALEAHIGPITRFVQAFPTTTNADRAVIGITVRTPRGRSTAAPATRPVVLISGFERFTHTLHLVDEATPTRKARPAGAERAEVYVAFTPVDATPPQDPAAYRYIGSVSDGSTVLSFDPQHGGQQAHYIAKWMTRRSESGPWSDTASATVAA